MDKKSIIILSIVSVFIIGILVYQFSGIMPKSLELDKSESLPANLVCMVNDAYMAKEQIPVPVGDKVYYGCCEMCISTLQNKKVSRFAIDPYDGSEVDKANAFIVLKSKGSDAVLYFSSASNHQKFINKTK